MGPNKEDEIKRRAYELWEAEGRPHGRHDEHWRRAEQEGGVGAHGADAEEAAPLHPGMLGDGTEEQNLNQPGNPEARITQDDVNEAFAPAKQPKP